MKTVRKFIFRIFLVMPFLVIPQIVQAAETAKAKKLVLKTVARHPHDKSAYTQGLIFYEGFLYESTGMNGQSSVRKVEITTGNVLQKVPLKHEFFAEGMERIDNSLYVLTWQNQRCFVFDLKTLQYQKTFSYTGEGWGLAKHGEHLLLSNGSSSLQFYDPKDFSLKKKITVQEDNVKINNLNELEIVEHELWANIWGADRIVRIDPDSGKVLGWINCAAFVPEEFKKEHNNPHQANSVLNGIAYDPAKKRVYITGKNWPWLYELQVSFQ